MVSEPRLSSLEALLASSPSAPMPHHASPHPFGCKGRQAGRTGGFSHPQAFALSGWCLHAGPLHGSRTSRQGVHGLRLARRSSRFRAEVHICEAYSACTRTCMVMAVGECHGPQSWHPRYALYFLSLSPLAPSLSISKSKPSVAVAVLMDWSFVHKTWEKWASTSVGSSGEPLKAALLINYDPTGPSRLLSTIAEREGMKADPVDLTEFVDFVKLNKLQTDCFFIGKNQYIVTTIHENWFCARCLNTVKAAGEDMMAQLALHPVPWHLLINWPGN
ncbi:hypothetical protein CICLE_v10002031mg [Citrus x clementina]|uniref:Profilin n=1 Tax=Citrus clementina TaxID=85681 RepID=V4V2R1_CITCL|nr:hypothetical protein CICLE_v10002031mg [Citrus x clementina]